MDEWAISSCHLTHLIAVVSTNPPVAPGMDGFAYRRKTRRKKKKKKTKDRVCRGRKPTKQWGSIIYVRKRLIESRFLKFAQDEKSRKWNHPTRFLHLITEGRHEYASRQHTKQYASPSFPLEDGYGAIGTFLPQIGITETSKC